MSQRTVRCPKCGGEASGKFCGECGASLAPPTCPSCKTDLPAGVRFCHLCGTPLGAGAGAGAGAGTAHPRVARSTLPAWIAVGAIGTLGIGYIALQVFGSKPPGQQPSPPTLAPDLSQLTPRERADRLFDRIVRAAEAGDTAQVGQFQPMALAAYSMLPRQDSDSRYHVGLIHSLTGAFASARAQLDSIRATNPDHLLGVMLDFAIAQLTDNVAEQRQAYRDFLDAYDAEIALQKPEYAAHDPAIEAFLTASRQALGVNN